MRVFVDANTLVSGIAFHGLEHEVFKLGERGEAELTTSEDVIAEAVRALDEKFPAHAPRAKEFLRLANIRVLARAQYDAKIGEQKARDASDRHVLAAALASRSDFLVTGDRDLLSIAEPPLPIKTSRQLLAEIGAKKTGGLKP